MKHNYLRASVLLCLVFLCAVAGAFAQTTVTGKVTSLEDGGVLPGVSVSVKGTTRGTTTDANGKYSIAVDGSTAVLVFSFIGFTTEEVTVGNRTVVDMPLTADLQALSEVVVTGYTTENRREVTGAVATVKSKDLVAVPSGNVEQALQGRISGVTVITNGQPGTTSIVRLRGFGAFGGNEPLYIVDGVPVASTDFLQPDDIETTTVLKDAPSASIYGARAANGVIIYTTKKGKKGDGKLHVSYDGVFGVTTPGKVDNILNPQEQADWTWNAIKNTARQLGKDPKFESQQYGNGTTPVLPDYILVGSNTGVRGTIDLAAEKAKYNVNPEKGSIYSVMKANKAGTNWWDAITQNAILNRHTLSFSGSGERSQFYVSFGMQDQQGIIIHQNFKRYSFRINSEHSVTKHLRVGENVTGLYISRLGIIGGNGGRGSSGEETQILSAFRMPAIIPVYDEFGGYAGTLAGGFNNPRNPVAERDRSADNGGYNIGAIGNVYAELDLLKGLTLRSSFGGGISTGYYNYYNRPSYENSENNNTFTYGEGASGYKNWVFTNTARYQTKFGAHGIDVLAGIEALNTGNGRQFEARGQNPFSTDINYITLPNVSNQNVNRDATAFNVGVNFYSLFGRVQYSFGEKYMVNGVLRRDGSSRFGPNTRYGVFPAISGAWRISAEPFMKDMPFVSDLKLRGGWGQMGNSNNVDPNNQFSLFESNLGRAYYDIAGGNGAPTEGFYRNRIGNPNAKWETSTTSNIGIDATILDGKVELVFDLWRKDTKDLLYSLETPAVVGPLAADPSINIAKMRNQGIDLQIINRGNIIPDLTYEVNVTASWLKNEIVALAPGVPYFEPYSMRGITPVRNQIGQPISAFFGYKVIGLFQSQEEVNSAPAQDGKGIGRFRYADVNGDGKITPDDRTALGSPVPKFNGGLNLTLGYKNLELTAFLYTALGFQNFNLSRWYTDFYPSFKGAAIGNRVKESFTFEKGGNTVPIFEDASNLSTNTVSNSYYIEKGNYARLTNLQIAYKLPAALLSRYGIERAKIYIQSTNLFTISKYSGLDPGVGGAADQNLGIDVGNPPVTRGFNLGVNFGF
ncbi:TonB-dependent receptor [Cytophagaceae bacterium DM2B3-1]|uniref:TonB-dependent receptor n=1 Tax=Xanthocytophaga flava TaxID=3048013 RepID=A0ABT7CM87_9BACT|nr:TonB-dependent receptor [Xanthocytophaga flavus]MDJ1494864.1 TonB-dependent receptor [Xanthocytophaga flavus]